MDDISKHLFDAHTELKNVYENVNIRNFDKANHHADEALFHVRCAILWLRDKNNADKNNV